MSKETSIAIKSVKSLMRGMEGFVPFPVVTYSGKEQTSNVVDNRVIRKSFDLRSGRTLFNRTNNK